MTRRKPRNRAQKDLHRPPRDRYATRSLDFTVREKGGRFGSDAVWTCRGTLYLPANATRPRVVVMAPPAGADRSFGLPAFAERLAVAGNAAFTVDYRGFGDSDGDDRLVDPDRQRTDLAAAIERVRRVDDLGDELVVWGAGLGGGHALALAGERRDVDAAVALAPITDWRAAVRRRGVRAALRAGLAGLRDALGHRIGLGRDVPVVGDAGELALVVGTGAKRDYLDLVDRDSDWRNLTPARSIVKLARDDAVPDPDAVRTPALVIAGVDDEQAPADEVGDLAEALPASTLVRLPADHFSVFGADFEPVVGYTESFLADVFGSAAAGPTSR